MSIYRRNRKELTEEYLRDLYTRGLNIRQLEIESGWNICKLYAEWKKIGIMKGA